MATILDFDEIHRIGEYITNRGQSNNAVKNDIIDLLLYSYIEGVNRGNEDLSTNFEDFAEDMYICLYKEIGGKSWEDRVDEYLTSETDKSMEIIRVIDTESHRMYNEGIGYVGEKAEEEGKTIYKTWSTMGDERVRDTHDYLDGMKVPFNEKFYTYDGDSAMYCGGFDLPENNINCRCWITLST